MTWNYGSASEANTLKESVIVTLEMEGLLGCEITARVGCNWSSVSLLLKRKHKTGDVRRKPGTGL
jgi:transposase